jgi:monofunctional biosynthetic peptidoglycan transglycosylase
VLYRVLRIFGLAFGAVVAIWMLGLLAYRWIDPPLTPLMLIRWPVEGRLDYRPVPLAATAPALREAVIASEDNRFCLHAGVDWNAVEDALEEYETRGRMRGASTITMQTARNLFLWPGGGAVRKLFEVPLAYAMEALWPKRRIMELYLSIAEWGHGIYGAEAGARAHFGKDAAGLTRREAALLAAVLPNPRRFDAGKPSAYVDRRADRIMARARRLGGLDACVETRRAPKGR